MVRIISHTSPDWFSTSFLSLHLDGRRTECRNSIFCFLALPLVSDNVVHDRHLLTGNRHLLTGRGVRSCCVPRDPPEFFKDPVFRAPGTKPGPCVASFFSRSCKLERCPALPKESQTLAWSSFRWISGQARGKGQQRRAGDGGAFPRKIVRQLEETQSSSRCGGMTCTSNMSARWGLRLSAAAAAVTWPHCTAAVTWPNGFGMSWAGAHSLELWSPKLLARKKLNLSKSPI